MRFVGEVYSTKEPRCFAFEVGNNLVPVRFIVFVLFAAVTLIVDPLSLLHKPHLLYQIVQLHEKGVLGHPVQLYLRLRLLLAAESGTHCLEDTPCDVTLGKQS